MPLKEFAIARPMRAALCCAGLQFFVTTFILKAGVALMPAEAFGKVKLLAFASTVVVPLLLAHGLGLWRALGLDLARVRLTPVFLAALLPCVVLLSMGAHMQDQNDLGSEAVMQLVNAFGEELLFRGVIFAILLALPRWQAIAISGVLFGSMHLIHGFMDGNWNQALWWAVATAVPGMMFAAVRYGTGSLWMTILVHMFVNLATIYSNVEYAAGPLGNLVVDCAASLCQIAIVAYVIRASWRPDALVPA